jgi:2',3'-cyclic-nucleotide 2'-phosphodiesterase (5'-nucleotidase family)
MKFMIRNSILVILLAGVSCSGPYVLNNSRTAQVRIKQDSLQLVDSAIVRMIAPYKQKLDAQMNEIIAVSDVDLIKEHPEGGLCNLVADAVMSYGNKTYEKPVDICVLNYGGIRIPSVAKGNITLGKVYEIMPFDNQLEVLEIDASTCKKLLDHVAKNGGWPVSGVSFRINNAAAENIQVKGRPLDENRTYLLITSDYIINGGDNATMLGKPVKRTALNYKVRDAIIDYLREVKSNNQTINTQKDGRITVAQPENIH